MDNFSLSKIKQETKYSINYIIKFCNERNVNPPTLKKFFSYKKENTIIQECIYYFMGNNYSKYYFFNSISFYEFYNLLPTDFQKDIANQDEMTTIRRLTMADTELSNFLISTLKKDFWSYK